MIKGPDSNSDSSSEYHAMSYVWGASTRTWDIEIDGRTVKVTQSLGEALTSIRKNTTCSMIWADAISINQDDVEERGLEKPSGIPRRRLQRPVRKSNDTPCELMVMGMHHVVGSLKKRGDYIRLTVM